MSHSFRVRLASMRKPQGTLLGSFCTFVRLKIQSKSRAIRRYVYNRIARLWEKVYEHGHTHQIFGWHRSQTPLDPKNLNKIMSQVSNPLIPGQHVMDVGPISVKRAKGDDWDRLKPIIIKQLYITEGKKLKEVMDIILEQYGLKAR